MSRLVELLETMPQCGQLRWISVRPEKTGDLRVLDSAEITAESGLEGDHFAAKPGADRQVTLIQWEHLQVVSSIVGKEVQPEQLRRNLAVAGINLLALKNQQFAIGGQVSQVILQGTGNCPPCSRMEENLGPGGYSAMRGHGGITARVVQGGKIAVGDPVSLLPRCE